MLFGAGQTVPNAVMVGLGPPADLDFYNQSGSVHVILDLSGYFTPG